MHGSCRLGPWAARPRVARVTAFRKEEEEEVLLTAYNK